MPVLMFVKRYLRFLLALLRVAEISQIFETQYCLSVFVQLAK